jgi:DNA polymerase-3 subunit delta'
MLEEPPRQSLFLVVSHAPGRLLPTIRSRCRRLAFAAWSEDAAAQFVEQRAGVSPSDARRLAQMAHGAPGQALSLAEAGALEADRSAHDILNQLPQTDDAKLLAIADRFRGPEGQARFNLIVERLADQVQTMIHRSAAGGETGGLARWADAWSMLTALPGEVEAINLDRTDAFFSVIGELRAAARA